MISSNSKSQIVSALTASTGNAIWNGPIVSASIASFGQQSSNQMKNVNHCKPPLLDESKSIALWTIIWNKHRKVCCARVVAIPSPKRVNFDACNTVSQHTSTCKRHETNASLCNSHARVYVLIMAAKTWCQNSWFACNFVDNLAGVNIFKEDHIPLTFAVCRTKRLFVKDKLILVQFF